MLALCLVTFLTFNFSIGLNRGLQFSAPRNVENGNYALFEAESQLITSSFGLCLRINLRYVDKIALVSCPDALEIELYPSKRFGLVSYFHFTIIFALQEQTASKPGKWYSFCFDIENRFDGLRLTFVVNGVTHADKTYFHDGSLRDMKLPHILIGNNVSGTISINGKLTDLNVWNRSLTIQEMNTFTTDCGDVDGKGIITLLVVGYSSSSRIFYTLQTFG